MKDWFRIIGLLLTIPFVIVFVPIGFAFSCVQFGFKIGQKCWDWL